MAEKTLVADTLVADTLVAETLAVAGTAGIHGVEIFFVDNVEAIHAWPPPPAPMEECMA